MSARDPFLRATHARDARYDPESRREPTPASQTPCLESLTDACVALSVSLVRSFVLVSTGHSQARSSAKMESAHRPSRTRLPPSLPVRFVPRSLAGLSAVGGESFRVHAAIRALLCPPHLRLRLHAAWSGLGGVARLTALLDGRAQRRIKKISMFSLSSA